MDVTDSKTVPVAELTYASASKTGAAVPLRSDWVLALADRHRRKLLLALIVIYILGFNAQWRVEPDSALYLTVGRNLAEGHGYTFQGSPHRLAFPGLPLLFAGIFKLFHTEHLLPALIIMMIMGAATLALTYRLFLLYADRPTAVLVTFGLGISRLFYRYCFELLSDLPFLLGVMAFLVGYEAIFYSRKPVSAGKEDGPQGRWFDWVLLFAGLAVAIAMRPSMWALLVAIVLTLAWSIIRGNVRWPELTAICLALIAMSALFWKLDPRHGSHSGLGQYEDGLFEVTFAHAGKLLHNLVFENIPQLFEATLSQALFGARLGPGLSSLAGVGVILVSATMLLKRPLWFFWVAMTFVMMLVAIKPLDRYFLEILPLLVFAWWSGLRWINHRLPQPWANRIFLALFILGGTTNLLRCGEFIVEQRRVPFRSHYKEGRYASTDKVAKLLRTHLNEDAWVLGSPKCNRILTFLSHRNVVGPSTDEKLSPKRNNVYLLEPAEDAVLKKLDDLNGRPGPQVGPTIQSRYDPEPWRLRRAEPQ